MITFLIAVGASFIGNLLSLSLWFHFDVEGWWQQRRLKHGKKLDKREREAADKHGYRNDGY